MSDAEPTRREWRLAGIRFDRNELAGMFGDLGTDLPLLVGMTLAAGLDSAGVLTLFGLFQVLTALRYRLPMPVQPLKATAALVIATQPEPGVIFGAGLSIGAVMLLLTITGALGWLAEFIPRCVVRGIQLGLGIQLASVALREFVGHDGAPGYALAAVLGLIALLLRGNRRWPAALFIVAGGLLYAAFRQPSELLAGFDLGFALPSLSVPTWSQIAVGFVTLALPQIPLSVGNSILATRQVVADLFPERQVGIRQIGLTYSLMNLIGPWFGAVPTCHGSGGMVGHYTFGARTGGSVVLYGLFFLLLGLFASDSFANLTFIFPLPALGVLLLFEAVGLMALCGDQAERPRDWQICLLTGALAFGLPYGFVVGLIVGTALARSQFGAERNEVA